MPLLTFIIPAFNVEIYIEECINSILQQDFVDFEILIIDDGSEDSTRAICCEIAEQDSRVKVITQKNAGTSSARNKGIVSAKGKYVVFVDSDDYLKRDILAGMASLISCSESDVLVYNYEIFDCNANITVKEKLPLSIFENESTLLGIMYMERILSAKKLYPWYPWCYAIKKSYLIDNKFFFKEGIHFEDVDLIYKILINAKSVVCYDREVYHYRFNRAGSLTAKSSINLKTENDKLMIVNNNINLVNELKISRKLKAMLCHNFSYLWYISLSLHPLFNNCTEKNMHKSLLIKYNAASTYTKSFSLRIISIAVKAFGIEKAAFFCNVLLGE